MVNDELIEKIIFSITNRRKVSFSYEGVDRVMKPYVIGHLKIGDNPVVLYGWLLSGDTEEYKQNDYQNWRTFLLEYILDFKILVEKYPHNEQYPFPLENQFKDIICKY